jgi:deoxyribodipyrimidine photolyase
VIVALIAGCKHGPTAAPDKEKASATEPEKTAPGQTEPGKGTPEKPDGPTEGPKEPAPPDNTKPEVKVPKPNIPVADAETQKKINAAIAKFKDASAKPEERQDALLTTLVAIGPIATPDVLRLTLDRSDASIQRKARKFFSLLSQKEAYTALVYQLFSDDQNMRNAANAMLTRLTSNKGIGYDASAAEAVRYEAIKKWAAALGVEGIQ